MKEPNDAEAWRRSALFPTASIDQPVEIELTVDGAVAYYSMSVAITFDVQDKATSHR